MAARARAGDTVTGDTKKSVAQNTVRGQIFGFTDREATG
jgi:hypothetical protein